MINRVATLIAMFLPLAASQTATWLKDAGSRVNSRKSNAAVVVIG